MGEEFPHHRGFTRVLTHLKVRVTFADGQFVAGPARDISLTGVYVQGDHHADLGDACEVEVCLTSDAELSVKAESKVVRAEPGGIAVEFTAVSLDALDHLQKIVLYNAEDPEKVEAELSSHLGLKPR